MDDAEREDVGICFALLLLLFSAQADLELTV